ncbi:MAG: hypothetical protein Q8880_03720 [Bacteroidota bacterium]|nr:hypothetical protein [Bacteroidota bacterium]
MRIFCVLFISIFFLTNFVNGQNCCTLNLISANNSEKKIIEKKITENKKYTTKEDVRSELKKLIYTLHDEAYITATIDSITEDSISVTAYITTGKEYKWVILKKGNADEDILRAAYFSIRQFSKKPVYYKQVNKLMDRILENLENNGYPFGVVKLDKIIFSENNIEAEININKKKRIQIDSIVINGNAKISLTYIYNAIGIKPGDYYNENLFGKIGASISNIPFLVMKSTPKVVFWGEKAEIILNIDKKKANQFDAIIGIMPANDIKQSTMVTGEAHIKLLNSFKRGELIEFNWRKPEQYSQELKTNFNYPFVLSSPFGCDLHFDLYKKDTSYINITRSIGITYYLRKGFVYKAYYENQTSEVLSTQLSVNSNVNLPGNANITNNTYGLEVKGEKLDYNITPTQGYRLIINSGIGSKHISKNSGNEELFKDIKEYSTQYRTTSQVEFYNNILKRHVLLFDIRGGIIRNASIFENEMFRLGGLNSLRGFDDQSIYVSSYGSLLAEYRYMLDKNSYFNLFWNGAYYKNQNKGIIDRPYGFGGGISFETKAGVFSIVYALGKQFDNPISFKAAKIHFGVSSYF